MAPTLVALAVGVLLAVALLGSAFDRRSVAVVAGAAVFPDLDAIFALVGPGGPNATLHAIVIPLGAAAVLYHDTRRRERSWFAARWGARGVRIAWVAIAACAVAGIGLDAFTGEGVALLYPLSDRYVSVTGRLVLSTREGIVQTYVSVGDGMLGLASPGTIDTHVVETPLSPVDGARRIRLVDSGWQAIVVVTALVAAPAKWLVEHRDRTGGDR